MQNLYNNTYAWLGGGVILAIIIAGVLYAFARPMQGGNSTTASSTAASTTVDLGGGVTATLPPGVTLSDVNTTIEPPSLNGSIKITPSNSAQADQILRNDEETVIAQLKQDPTRVDLWLQLGVYRKMAGDYQGAIEAWNYVAKAAPPSVSYVAYGDLGDLYTNFDKNYAKAVASYKAAIAINPKVVDYYNSLYILYRYDLNDKADAADIVAKGLLANPQDPTLLSLQKQL